MSRLGRTCDIGLALAAWQALHPWRVEWVYSGSGTVRAEGGFLVIKDRAKIGDDIDVHKKNAKQQKSGTKSMVPLFR